MSRKLTTEEIIRRFTKKHGTTYNYDKVIYINAQKKVTITCKTHGDFTQKPQSHSNGFGCAKCSGLIKLTKDEFITKSKQVHKEKYDYSKVNYVNSRSKVVIVCKTHGEFKQIAGTHQGGAGCAECMNMLALTTKSFIFKANKVHERKYKYTNVNYKNSKTKIIITCKTHGDFKQIPNAHLMGQGCPYCASSTDNDTVYIWVIPNTNIYKIGITSKRLGDSRVKEVASKMGVDYEIIGAYNVKDARSVEKELHDTYQIRPTTLPKNDGHTEFRILTESDVNEITYYLENVVGEKI